MNKLLFILAIILIGLTGCGGDSRDSGDDTSIITTNVLKEGFKNQVMIYLQGETFNAKRMLLTKTIDNGNESITLVTSDYTESDRDARIEGQPLGNSFGFIMHATTFDTLIRTIEASARPDFTTKEFKKFVASWNFTHLSTESQSGGDDHIILVEPKNSKNVCLQTAYTFKFALCWKSYEATELSTQLQEMKLTAK